MYCKKHTMNENKVKNRGQRRRKKGRLRTYSGLGHRVAVVREAFETAEEERTRALERLDSFKLAFLVR